MIWTTLTEGLARALETIGLGDAGANARLELAIPRESAHGDWTTNVALLLAKSAGRPPRALA